MLYETIESQENIQLEKARQDDVSDPESLELVEIKPLRTNANDNSGIRLLIDGIEIAQE